MWGLAGAHLPRRTWPAHRNCHLRTRRGTKHPRRKSHGNAVQISPLISMSVHSVYQFALDGLNSKKKKPSVQQGIPPSIRSLNIRQGHVVQVRAPVLVTADRRHQTLLPARTQACTTLSTTNSKRNQCLGLSRANILSVMSWEFRLWPCCHMYPPMMLKMPKMVCVSASVVCRQR